MQEYSDRSYCSETEQTSRSLTRNSQQCAACMQIPHDHQPALNHGFGHRMATFCRDDLKRAPTSGFSGFKQIQQTCGEGIDFHELNLNIRMPEYQQVRLCRCNPDTRT